MGRPMSVDECARLRRLAGGDHMRLLLLFLMGTAARPSSILELDWSQMDYEHGLIHLNKPDRAQTKKVRPIVKMPTALSQLHGTGLVICWKGKPVARPMTSWRKLRKRAGLGPDVTLYSFRHTLGRWMRAQGVSDGEIGLQLGHRKLGVTERYAPYGPDYLTGAVAAINRFLDEVLRSKSVAAQLQKPPSGGRSSVVEHQLPKLSVEGSIPFARSNFPAPRRRTSPSHYIPACARQHGQPHGGTHSTSKHRRGHLRHQASRLSIIAVQVRR